MPGTKAIASANEKTPGTRPGVKVGRGRFRRLEVTVVDCHIGDRTVCEVGHSPHGTACLEKADGMRLGEERLPLIDQALSWLQLARDTEEAYGAKTEGK